MSIHSPAFLSKYVPIFKVSRYTDDCLVVDAKSKTMLVNSLYGQDAPYPEELPNDIVVLCDSDLGIALHCQINKTNYTTRFYLRYEPCDSFTCIEVLLTREDIAMRMMRELGVVTGTEYDLNVVCDSKQYVVLKDYVRSTFFNILFYPNNKANYWTCEEIITKNNNAATINPCVLSMKILPDCRRTYVYGVSGSARCVDIQKEHMTLRADGMTEIHTIKLPTLLNGLSVPDVHVTNLVSAPEIVIDTLNISSIFGDCVPDCRTDITADLTIFAIGRYICTTRTCEPKILVHTNNLQFYERNFLNTAKIMVTDNTIACGNLFIMSKNPIVYVTH